MSFGLVWERVWQRKTCVADETQIGSSNRLARVLGYVDLVCLTVGSTLGLGVYVLTGDVARNQTGPAVILAFLVAALASLLSALCYAEFAARVPRAGSAYIYSYVCIGEVVAFIIGWNLILEYVIGTASVARGYSGYVNSLFNNSLRDVFRYYFPINISFLSPYPDFFASALIISLAVASCLGVKRFTKFNNILTISNIIVVLVICACALIKGDLRNWTLSTDKHPNGFLPYGVFSVFTGAARCFYAFIGFDTVAAAGEESKNAQKVIPLAILSGLLIVFLAYVGISSSLTLLVPYFLLNDETPLPSALAYIGWNNMAQFITFGALFGLTSSLLGGMYPMPRIVYSMANDGLLFQWLGRVHSHFRTPVFAIMSSASLSALLSALFDLSQLIDMMSIGTLMAYTLISSCVLILRYRFSHSETRCMKMGKVASSSSGSKDIQLNQFCGIFLGDSGGVVTWVTFIYGILCCLFSLSIKRFQSEFHISSVLLLTLMLICVMLIRSQAQSDEHLHFKVPFVPYVPLMSIFINIYLMSELGRTTWIRLCVWVIIGSCIYICYGYSHSTLRLAALRKLSVINDAVSETETELFITAL